MESINTQSVERFSDPYSPRELASAPEHSGVFVTATWAQSIDARIAAAPGTRTQLSGSYSKKMTHYSRSVHDAISVGKNTVVADDPSSSCRYSADAKSPRPVISDSAFAWPILDREWKVSTNAQRGSNLGPWVVVDRDVDPRSVAESRACGGDVISVQNTKSWPQICAASSTRGIKSLMVEGGAAVSDGCSRSGAVSSSIVTHAPVFSGRHGVEVSPLTEIRPHDVQWWSTPGVPDSVLAAKLQPTTHR